MYESELLNLRSRRERNIAGKINCIPFNFERLGEYYYGLEKKEYNIYTASQKIGKSKFVDNICVYHPIFYSLAHPDELKFHVLYFTLEATAEDKLHEYMSFLLYHLDKIRISPKDLKSTKKGKPCPQEVLDLLESEKYQVYLKKFHDSVEFIHDIKNPTGIKILCQQYAEALGHWTYKTIKIKENGKEVDKQVKDKFIENDPELYNIIVLDNFTNLALEKSNTKLTNIESMSKFLIELRDDYYFCINAVQHQAQSQEGIENRKLNQIEPSSDGLGDCKMTTRDINNLWGLFSPFKYGIKRYPDGPNGYDITRFGDKIRFIKLLEGRSGGMGVYSALLFDGVTSTFTELPKPDDIEALQRIYNEINPVTNITNRIFLIINKFKTKWLTT